MVSQVRAASVFYRGGIAFDRHLPWMAPHEGYPLPASEQSDPLGRRADATPIILWSQAAARRFRQIVQHFHEWSLRCDLAL